MDGLSSAGSYDLAACKSIGSSGSGMGSVSCEQVVESLEVGGCASDSCKGQAEAVAANLKKR